MSLGPRYKNIYTERYTNPVNRFGVRNDPAPTPFWKDLMLAAFPAFVAGVLPPVVMHFLDRNAAKNAPATPVTPAELPKEEKKNNN